MLTMEMTSGLNVVDVQALAYIAGERILAKLLFLPTTLNKGAVPKLKLSFETVNISHFKEQSPL